MKYGVGAKLYSEIISSEEKRLPEIKRYIEMAVRSWNKKGDKENEQFFIDALDHIKTRIK